jgi:hypothetical protein
MGQCWYPMLVYRDVVLHHGQRVCQHRLFPDKDDCDDCKGTSNGEDRVRVGTVPFAGDVTYIIAPRTDSLSSLGNIPEV